MYPASPCRTLGSETRKAEWRVSRYRVLQHVGCPTSRIQRRRRARPLRALPRAPRNTGGDPPAGRIPGLDAAERHLRPSVLVRRRGKPYTRSMLAKPPPSPDDDLSRANPFGAGARAAPGLRRYADLGQFPPALRDRRARDYSLTARSTSRRIACVARPRLAFVVVGAFFDSRECLAAQLSACER
jgi:hypothetical protein